MQKSSIYELKQEAKNDTSISLNNNYNKILLNEKL